MRKQRRTQEQMDTLRGAIYAVAETDKAGERPAYLLPDGHSGPGRAEIGWMFEIKHAYEDLA